MRVSIPQRLAFLRIALFGLSVIALGPLTAQSAEKKKSDNSRFTATEVEEIWEGKSHTRILIEMEYQLISVPNSQAGKILGLTKESEIRPAVLGLLRRGEAKLYDISKTVTMSGNRANCVSRTTVEMEPTISPDHQTLDLTVALESKPSKIILSASIPAGHTLYLGSFENPDPDSNATIFLFAKWKSPEL